MMEFLLLTASIALGILIATAVMIIIMMQPVVMKAYMKWALKLMDKFDYVFDEKEEAKDL